MACLSAGADVDPEKLQAEFDAWLNAPPPKGADIDPEQAEIRKVLGV